MYFLYVILMKNLNYVEIDKKTHVVKVSFNQFVFFNTKLSTNDQVIAFSYKEEVGARGIKHMFFTLYDSEDNQIIKLSSGASGWSSDKLEQLAFLLRDNGIQEILD